MTINEAGKKMMEAMGQQRLQTLNQIVRRAHVPRHQAIVLLARLIRYDLATWELKDHQFRFSLRE